MTCSVRPGRAEDLPAIADLLTRTGLAIEGVDYRDLTGMVLVAELDQAVVGFVQVLPARPYAVVTEIAVAPEHQGQGIAHRLVEAMEVLLRWHGVTAWATCCGDKNVRAQSILTRYATSRGAGMAYIRRLT